MNAVDKLVLDNCLNPRDSDIFSSSKSSAGGPIVDVESSCHVQAICLLFGYFSSNFFLFISFFVHVFFFCVPTKTSIRNNGKKFFIRFKAFI